MSGDDPGPIPGPSDRAALRTAFGDRIQSGLSDLQQALNLDLENADTMTYVNLLLRLQADLEDTAEAAKRDVAAADNWLKKAIDEKAKAAGATQR
jgi:hypothetical protein